MARSDALEWVDVGDLLHSTGARNLSLSGEEYTFSCMGGAHAHGDAAPSAGMNARTSRWRCRNPACGLKGNAVDYLVALKGYTRSESLRVLSERYGGPENSVEEGALSSEVERIRAEEPEQPERVALTEDEYLDRFAIHWPDWSVEDLPAPMSYMRRRGFEAITLNEWGIGYDELSDRVTIPVYDVEGSLVGVKGRAWNDRQPKYILIGDAIGREPRYGFNTYSKSEHVFGLQKVESARDLVVVVEGELNAMALWQMGVPAVAVSGSDFSHRQCGLIATRFDEVVVYFDDDAAGVNGMREVATRLSPYVVVSVVLEPPGDAADALDPEKPFSLSNVDDLLTGAKGWLSFLVGTVSTR